MSKTEKFFTYIFPIAFCILATIWFIYTVYGLMIIYVSLIK